MASRGLAGERARREREEAQSDERGAARAQPQRVLARVPDGRQGEHVRALLRRPDVILGALGCVSLLVYGMRAGMAERVYTTWHLANQRDRAISATMPLAGLFRAAIAWVPRRLPAPLPGSAGPDAPFLMAIWGEFAFSVVLFALYACGLCWLARSSRSDSSSLQMWRIAGFGVAFGVLVLFTPAAPSHDPIAYATAGRLLGSHGANPFFVVPSAFPADRVLAANEWPQSTTAYGPLWALLSLALNALVAGDPLRANMIYRIVAFLANLANIGLVSALLRLLPARHATWRERGLLLYAWNPLVVVEVAAGHNDVLMLTLLLMGLWLLARHHAAWGMAWLGGAILVKANALPLVVLVALGGWLAARPGVGPRDGRGWVRGLGPAAVALAVVLLGYLPFYWGHSIADIAAASKLQSATQALSRALDSSFGTLASSGAVRALPAPLSAAIASASHAADSPTLWTLLLAAGAALVTLLLLPHLPRATNLPPVLAWVYVVWMAFLCVFHLLRAWYLIPLVGLICLTPAGRPIRRFTLALSATMQGEVLFLSKSPPFGGWQPWTLLLVLGIPMTVLIADARRDSWDWRITVARSVNMLRARLGLRDMAPSAAVLAGSSAGTTRARIPAANPRRGAATQRPRKRARHRRR